ncbi:MAG: DUF3107 domain-containing protein, partial [Actinomycetota bacterium]
LELEGSADEVKKAVDKALANDDGVLWLTDKQGRTVSIPSDRVAYVEVEPNGGTKRVGFGRT